MVTTSAILSETFFVRWLEKSLYDFLEVLHGSFTDYGAIKSIRFRNARIKDGLGKFGLSVVGDEGDTYVDSGHRLYLVSAFLKLCSTEVVTDRSNKMVKEIYFVRNQIVDVINKVDVPPFLIDIFNCPRIVV